MSIKPTYIIDLCTKTLKTHKTNQARLIDEISVVITDGNQSLLDFTLAQYLAVDDSNFNPKANFPDDLYKKCNDQLEGISPTLALYKRKPYGAIEFINSSSPMVCDYWFRAIGKNAGKFFIPTGFGLPHGKSKQGWYFIKLIDRENTKLINLEDVQICDSTKKFKAPISKQQVLDALIL